MLLAVVGGPRVIEAQLRHVADLSTRPNTTVRILPFSAGFPLGIALEPFVLLDFGVDGPGKSKGKVVEPPVVYLETLTGSLYQQQPRVIERYHQTYETIRKQALDPVASRSLLRQAAKEFAP